MFKMSISVIFALTFVLCIAQSGYAASDPNNTPTTIGDLPIELFLTIYDNFNVDNLRAVAKVNSFHRHVAERVFSQKIANKELLINDDGLNIRRNGKIVKNICEIHSIYLSMETFGHLITDLSIDYGGFSDFESIILNERLSKYLTNSLVDIELTYFTDKLNGLTGPFTKVKSVHLSKARRELNEINLSGLFPQMEKLIVEKLVFSPASLERNFVHLEHLHIGSLESTTINIAHMLEVNPKIRYLYMNGCDLDFFRLLSKVAPQLETLEIMRFLGGPSGGLNIHFEHLKSLTFHSSVDFPLDSDPLPITFSKLEEFKVDTLFNVFFEIMKQNKDLKKVAIFGKRRISGERLQEIAKKLEKLEEFTTSFDVYSDETVEPIVHFIATAKKLNKIKLWSCMPEFHDKVHERIRNEWDMVEETYRKFVTFVRRQTDGNGI